MGHRDGRAQSAQETLAVIEQGFYLVEGKKVDIGQWVEASVNQTTVYAPEDFKQVLADAETRLLERQVRSELSVQNATAMTVATDLLQTGAKIGCLNFASAKNPGGGFLGGAQAQEESLCRASALYLTQMRYFSDVYEFNRSRRTYLYSDYMIYSPDVPFFKDDGDALLPCPYQMDILTCPAVNIGAMRNNRPEELLLAEEVMISRMDKLLSVFVLHGVKTLILGAWGCGVFQNNPADIARYFAFFLGEKGKYSGYFDRVVFAVLDRSKGQENISAFQRVFDA